MSSLFADVRYALRAMKQRPRVAAVAVLTLALGVGAATAVASAVWSVLVQPLPLQDPAELVFVWHRTRAGELLPLAAPDAALYRERMRGISGLAFGDRVDDVVLTTAGQAPAHLRVGGVSSDFFAVLGVRAAIGRTFTPEEGRPTDGDTNAAGGPPTVVVLSHRAWRAHFGGDPGVLGRAVRLDGQAATVIGVLAPDFVLPMPSSAGTAGAADAWTPLPQPLAAMRRVAREEDQDSDNRGLVIARLRPGTSLATATADANRVTAALRRLEPAAAVTDVQAVLDPVAEAAVRRARPVLALLAAGVALAILTAVANLASLLLATTVRRRRELAVRRALGASRGRVARLLLTESLVLALAGALAGVVIAAWVLPGLRGIGALGPLMERASLSGPWIVAAVAVSAILGLLLGAAAALLALRTPDVSLLRAGASATPVPRAARQRLATVQVAVTVPLTVTAVLLLRTLGALDAVPLGFAPSGAFVTDLGLRHPDRHRGPADRARALAAIEEALAAEPDVEATGAISRAPLSGRRWATWYAVGEDAGPERRRRADLRMVTPGYFGAVGTRLLAGRTFTDTENRIEERRVAVVDRALADRWGGPLDALGRMVTVPLDGQPVTAEIVGVVESVHFESIRERQLPAVYVPYRHEASRDVSVVIRWRGERAGAGAVIAAAVTRADPGLVPFNSRWLTDDVARAESETRTASIAVTGFALLTALLAGIGLVAGVTLQTRTRTREFAVRAAVGATPSHLVRIAGRDGLRVLVAGLALGGVLAAVAGRIVRSLLYAVSPTDPASLAVALAVTAALGLAAVFVPARGVLRMEPAEALRHD